VSDFLYPFLTDEPTDVGALVADLAGSARSKAADSAAIRAATLQREAAVIDAGAAAMADRLDAGGRLFTIGNGGSSTDAASVASLFASPPWGRALPARCLVENAAVLTALGNDVGFDLVFSRQMIAHGRPGDTVIGLSTSGNSRNLFTAFHEARSRDILTIGFAGYDGGEMGRSDDVDHCLVVRSDSVHRIQEAQSALAFALWSAVQDRLAAVEVTRG
jgi:D-sedoheptulose 7-phosphate isomerase